MRDKKIAVVGGAFAGLALAAGIVRAAVGQDYDNLSITIYEPNLIGPGVAYDVDAPNTFALNHELNFMGSVNVRLDHTDTKDFYNWVQQNLAKLQPLYPDYDLTSQKAYVPRNLFGRYLRARYAELREFARDNGIAMYERPYKVDNIRPLHEQFVLETQGTRELFDTVVLATGNYFKPLDPTLAQSGRRFRPYDYKQYVSGRIPDGSVMLITGSALSAYDAALYALGSGKYHKVIMASRRGMLRKVRGNIVPYDRKYITLENLETMAGGPDKPFRLAHLMKAIKAELRHAYGKDVSWKNKYTISDILQILKFDITTVKADKTLLWRSIHNSLNDDERHEIYARLAPEDKQEFVQKYASLYQLFSAPMPVTNASKLLKYLEAGQLELQNGARGVTYSREQDGFLLHYAHNPDNTPVDIDEPAMSEQTYPTVADVYVDATGLGRDIRHIPLYRHLMGSGLVAHNSLGGIQVDIASRRVVDVRGKLVSGLYAVGQMTCGETVLPHNSVHLSRLGIAVGTDIVTQLSSSKQKVKSLEPSY